MKRVFDALADHARNRPAATAFADGGRRIGWADLARAVSRAAGGFRAGPPAVGLRLTGIDMVIADLAATLSGCRVVPVPAFFSAAQTDHLLADAGAVPVDILPAGPALDLHYRGGAERAIYTSGTTGRPKGVILGDQQLNAAIRGLSAALRPGPGDRYLSVLPQAQLLEQICGMCLPIVAGAETVISAEAGASIFTGDGAALARIAAEVAPSVTVIAPRQLTLWVAALKAGAPAPAGLRYVAVGGAPVAPALLAEARRLGLPVAEGYGLSEACSVVALTPPEGGGMVPLAGVDLTLDQGEIVVSGPTIMQGYLGHPAQTGPWRTGDLGRIDQGRLTVLGRRDAMILRQSGRNIAPEWVETEALADPAIPAAALIQTPADDLVLVAAVAGRADLPALFARLAGLPAYARPDRLVLADPGTAGLIRPSGTADRRVAAGLAADPALPVRIIVYPASAYPTNEAVQA